MDNLSNKVIIVTGASSGIGEQVALELAKHKTKLVIAAGRKDKLEEVAKQIEALGSQALVVQTDLTKVAQITNLVKKTLDEYGRIDILANIAGWGIYKWFEDYSFEEIKNQFDVNVLGLAELTRQVIPTMQKQRSGIIVNMSSYASEVAVPPMSVYASTKYAVKGLTDGLRRELAPWGIKVCRVHPGSVGGTEFNALSRERGGVAYDSSSIGRVSKQEVARQIVDLMQHPEPSLYIGLLYAFAAFFNYYTPGIVDLVMYYWVKRARKNEMK